MDAEIEIGSWVGEVLVFLDDCSYEQRGYVALRAKELAAKLRQAITPQFRVYKEEE